MRDGQSKDLARQLDHAPKTEGFGMNPNRVFGLWIDNRWFSASVRD